MTTIFMVCAVAGSVIVVVQFILSLAGVGHDFDSDFSADGADAFDPGAGHFDHPPGHEGGHFFGILSFRSVVAALAVFGLAGLASDTAGFPQGVSFVAALAAGAAALVLVAWTMRFLYGLRDDGTVHIERAVGHTGTVYLKVPAARAGAGKVFLNLQNRTVELQAVTAEESALPAGAPVVVVGVVGPNTVEVEPVAREERHVHA